MNQKVKCDNCQKKELITGSEGVYISHYRGIFRNDEKFHVCYECYKSKEQEYLQNYSFIYSYDNNQLKEKGTGYVKADNGPCYEDKKDQNGEILKQKNCRHCQPWKFPNNDNQEKCANCDKVIEQGETKYFGNDGKILCSMECVNIHNEKLQKPPKTCAECGKTIDKNQEQWTFEAGGNKKTFCSHECFGKWTERKNKPQQNNPPKSPNKGIPTGLKVFFWIGGIALIIIFTSMFAYQTAKKKKKKTEEIIIYDHK